jgi:hypothetical protein
MAHAPEHEFDGYPTSDVAVSVTGGCLCGEVRYIADVFLNSSYYCHCSICRRSSGVPAELSVPVRPSSLHFIKGGPKYFQSSVWMRRGFCATCGSRLICEPLDPMQAWATNITVGSLDEPERAAPFAHIFVDHQLSWFRPNELLPQIGEHDIEDFVAQLKARLGEDG